VSSELESASISELDVSVSITRDLERSLDLGRSTALAFDVFVSISELDVSVSITRDPECSFDLECPIPVDLGCSTAVAFDLGCFPVALPRS
jgi:hypothetical protein